jgi:uncharacterized protein involved in type VI secretion and phage assembly
VSLDLMDLFHDFLRYRRFGKYRGTVVDNQDSTNRGRLQVTVDAVLGSTQVWAMPCVPYAGDSVGFFAMPPVGSGVWVEFEAGDPSFPIWVGCFWADDEAPLGGDPTIKVWQTDSITISLDDQNDEATLENGSNASITMNDSVVTQATSAKHTVSSDGVASELGSGKVEVTTAQVSICDGKFQVTA